MPTVPSCRCQSKVNIGEFLKLPIPYLEASRALSILFEGIGRKGALALFISPLNTPIISTRV